MFWSPRLWGGILNQTNYISCVPDSPSYWNRLFMFSLYYLFLNCIDNWKVSNLHYYSSESLSHIEQNLHKLIYGLSKIQDRMIHTWLPSYVLDFHQSIFFDSVIILSIAVIVVHHMFHTFQYYPFRPTNCPINCLRVHIVL